jgi:hypothetical protein
LFGLRSIVDPVAPFFAASSSNGLMDWFKDLFGGLEHAFYDFPYIGNVIIPTDELHHFSEG